MVDEGVEAQHQQIRQNLAQATRNQYHPWFLIISSGYQGAVLFLAQSLWHDPCHDWVTVSSALIAIGALLDVYMNIKIIRSGNYFRSLRRRKAYDLAQSFYLLGTVILWVRFSSCDDPEMQEVAMTLVVMATIYSIWPVILCCLLIPCLPVIFLLRVCCCPPKTNQDFIKTLPAYDFCGEHSEFPNHAQPILWPTEKPTQIFISESPCCPICMEDYQQGESLRLLECAPVHHHYHQSCLDKWLVLNTTCPTCRRELDPEKVAEQEAQAQMEAQMEAQIETEVEAEAKEVDPLNPSRTGGVEELPV